MAAFVGAVMEEVKRPRLGTGNGPNRRESKGRDEECLGGGAGDSANGFVDALISESE